MERKRRAHHKSRGGCLTCKKRRVKCDETHPACKRCIRTGWSCSWPPEPVSRAGSFVPKPADLVTYVASFPYPLLATSSYPAGYCPPSCWSYSATIPHSLPSRIFQTPRESRYFDFFRFQTVLDLSGWSPSYFWQRLVLQMAHSESVARCAAIALGALQVDGPSSPHVLRYYGEALLALRGLLAQSESTWGSIDVCLTACLLLACFEISRKGFDAAQVHYTRGLEILKHCHSQRLLHQHITTVARGDVRQRAHRPSIPCYEPSLLEHFSMLETQIISILRSSPGYHQDPILYEGEVSQLPIPLQFTTIHEAKNSFVRLLHTIQNRATRTANQLAFARPDSQPDSEGIYPHRETYTASVSQAEYMRSVIRESLLGLTHWTQAFDAMLGATSFVCSGGGTLQQQRLVALLKGLSTMLYIRCSREPSRGEMSFDAFVAKFEFVVAQMRTAVDLGLQERSGISKEHPMFALGPGVLTGLHDLITKCRHQKIREEAIEVIGRLPYREGLWDGANAQRIVKAIVDLEERERVPGIQGPEGIPEKVRLVGVNFQFQTERVKLIADRLGGREEVWVELDL